MRRAMKTPPTTSAIKTSTTVICLRLMLRLLVGYEIRARSQALPKNIESGAHTLRKGIISVQGPDQERAKNGLAKDVRDVAGSEVLTNFAALLANGDEFSDEGMPASLI